MLLMLILCSWYQYIVQRYTHGAGGAGVGGARAGIAEAAFFMQNLANTEEDR
jgi:hypothetical protein